MTSSSAYQLMPYHQLPDELRSQWQNEVIPEVNSGETNELLNAIRENVKDPLAQEVIRIRRRDLNTIMNLVVNPEAGKIFGDYYRQDDATPFHPFARDIPWIIKKMTVVEKKDSFPNCNKEATDQLRPKLLNFLNTISNEELLYLCLESLEDFTKDWNGPVDLTKQLPLLISKIGGEGILGFKGMTEEIAIAMSHLAQAAPKQVPLLTRIAHIACDTLTGIKLYLGGKVKLHQSLRSDATGPFFTQAAREAWYYKQIELYVKGEVKAQIDANEQHSLLQMMMEYVRHFYGIALTAPLTEQAIDTIVQNYIFIAFAFQETTSSLLRHLIWDLAQNQNLQTYYRIVCLNNNDDLKFAALGVNFSSQSRQIANSHLRFLAQLKPLVEYGFDKYSSAGWSRLMRADFLLQKIQVGPATERKEFLKTWKLLKGEKVYYIPYISAMLYQDQEGSFADTQEKVPRKFYHFGSGIHSCVGQVFANKEILIVLNHLLKNFEFTPITSKLHFNFNHVLGTAEPVIVNVKRRIRREEQ